MSIAPIGTGDASRPLDNKEIAAGMAQLGASVDTIASVLHNGNVKEARADLAAAQTHRLAVINEENGTTHSTLHAAVKAGDATPDLDSSLNKAANVAKHQFG